MAALLGRLLLALIAVAVLAVVLAVADRTLARAAQRRASVYLTTPLDAPARVSVHGTPFLTQAVRGRYRDVEVSAHDLDIGVLRRTALKAHLAGVHLPLRDLLGRRVRELPVEHVHGHLLVPYAELARVSPVPGLGFSYRDGTVIATARLPVPGLGQVAGVTGEAAVSIGADGTVLVRVRNLAVAGFSVPDMLIGQLAPALAFGIALPPLPYGLRIQALTPTVDGLRVAGSAQAVVLKGAPTR